MDLRHTFLVYTHVVLAFAHFHHCDTCTSTFKCFILQEFCWEKLNHNQSLIDINNYMIIIIPRKRQSSLIAPQIFKDHISLCSFLHTYLNISPDIHIKMKHRDMCFDPINDPDTSKNIQQMSISILCLNAIMVLSKVVQGEVGVRALTPIQDCSLFKL